LIIRYIWFDLDIYYHSIYSYIMDCILIFKSFYDWSERYSMIPYMILFIFSSYLILRENILPLESKSDKLYSFLLFITLIWISGFDWIRSLIYIIKIVRMEIYSKIESYSLRFTHSSWRWRSSLDDGKYYFILTWSIDQVNINTGSQFL
jgi:hypothetical protein